MKRITSNHDANLNGPNGTSHPLIFSAYPQRVYMEKRLKFCLPGS
ncbi:MAG: hypothetical protein SWH78_01845 [Thermodesulfobacteriota bacterium]|nr:hypothetical protein [Thermodesulfobacteriota bacterium]